MLYVDIPTTREFERLVSERHTPCITLCVPTTPMSQEADKSRITFQNMAKAALEQLDEAGIDKHIRDDLVEHFDELAEDEYFWAHQANSLIVLAKPHSIRTFRLANNLTKQVHVSDRFDLKGLLRSITFAHSAMVLALSENSVRLVEIHADAPPNEVKVPGMPKDAASAVGTASVNSRSPSGRVQGGEGQNLRLRQYARIVDAALRPVLAGRDTPLILAAVERLQSKYRSVNHYPNLVEEEIVASPEHMSEAELAQDAQKVLDASYAKEIADLGDRYKSFVSSGRATTDVTHAAKAATYGAVDTLLIDMDADTPGTIHEETGEITFADTASAETYSVIDEIAGRVISTGGRVLAVRKTDLPDENAHLAAILRYAV